MPTKFFILVEPSFQRKGALRLTVSVRKALKQIVREIDAVEDTKAPNGLFSRHANLLELLQTLDPSPDIYVEEGHFTFSFGWTREPGQRLIRRCSKCHEIVNQAVFCCRKCGEPFPKEARQ